MCIRDSQRTYDMYFLRDARGNEVDLLLDFGHRMLMAEIKLNKTPRPDHAKNIETFQSELPGAPGAVSYTHLDVYKRQGVLFVVPLVREVIAPWLGGTLGQTIPLFAVNNPSGCA